MPKGRPPKDKTKLAIYLALKAQEQAEKSGKASVAAQENIVELNKALVYEDDPNETEEDVVLRISNRFDIFNRFARGATNGKVRSLIVSGAGGVGKTFTVEEVLKYASDNQGVKSEIVHGVLTPVNLYKLLYRNRHLNNVVVLDDADSIFGDEQALSVLKAALDTKTERKISWLSNGKALKSIKTGDDGDVPTDFIYQGTMIFITNLDFQKLVDSGKSKNVAHMQALMTRAIYLDLKLHTTKELTAWIRHIVGTKNILTKEYGVSKKEETEVLDYIALNAGKLRNLSIRTATKLAAMVSEFGEDWKLAAEATEFR